MQVLARRALTLLVLAPLAAEALLAQRPSTRPAAPRVPLSAVIAAFLADSGVPTRGLPWTTGSALPISWQTSSAVPNRDPNAASKGHTLTRDGSFTGTVGDSVALPMSISVVGAPSGLAQVGILISSMEVTDARGNGFFTTREMVETALRNEGLAFQPIKCSRAKEGASYGNLVDAVKAPGKTASGLWWMWDSPQQQMKLSLAILYRRADMNQVECQA